MCAEGCLIAYSLMQQLEGESPVGWNLGSLLQVVGLWCNVYAYICSVLDNVTPVVSLILTAKY